MSQSEGGPIQVGAIRRSLVSGKSIPRARKEWWLVPVSFLAYYARDALGVPLGYHHFYNFITILLFSVSLFALCVTSFKAIRRFKAGPKGHHLMTLLFVFVVGGVLAVLAWGISSHEGDEVDAGKSNSKASADRLPGTSKVASSYPLPQISDPALKAQMDEINRLIEFLGGKDEWGVWSLFDFPTIIKYNIMRNKDDAQPGSITPKDAEEMNAAFKDGQAVVNFKLASVSDKDGRVMIKEIKGQVCAINVTKKYTDSQQTLKKFETSPLLPQSIKAVLGEFDQTIAFDSLLLIEVLNDKLRTDPLSLVFAEDPSSPFCGVVCNTYIKRRTPLGPKQEKIMSAISEYLRTK